MYLCVGGEGVSILPLSTIFLLGFGTVPVVWYLRNKSWKPGMCFKF